MKTGFLFLLFIIFSGLYPTHLHAKGSKEVTYQNGFIQLINGYQSNGLLSLKKSHGEDIVLFRRVIQPFFQHLIISILQLEKTTAC